MKKQVLFLLTFCVVLILGAWLFQESLWVSKATKNEVEVPQKPSSITSTGQQQQQDIHRIEQALNYTKLRARKNYSLTDQNLIKELQAIIQNRKLTIHEIIDIANAKTHEKLVFTVEKSSSNPNQVLKTGKANCIGYAALFNAIIHYLLKDQGLEKDYSAQHLVGKLDFMGVDLHQFFDSPFLKDHDYNEIVNRTTKEKIVIDPSISDYLSMYN